MASLSPCMLCRAPEKLYNKIESNKRLFLVYGIFAILVIEWFSIIYQIITPQTPNLVYDSYLMKVYPLLSQLALFIMFFSLFLWKERLHFCFRKSATTFYLSLYYLLGVFSSAFCFSFIQYFALISYGSLGIATFIFIVSLFKSE